MTNAIALAQGGSLNTTMRNRIINGAMMIDQRNLGASVTPAADGTYTLDRWIARLSVASKYSVQQVADAPDGFINSLKITSLSSYTVGASEYFQVGQYLEGLNVQDLMWGTATAKTITVSFWAKSSLTGTFGGTLFGYQTGIPSYPFSYTINSANTWEQKTITVTGPTSGTFNTNNNGCFVLLFSFGVGSSISGTANTWNYSTLYRAPTGATSVVGTSGATFYITGVQLEAGTTATPFEYRLYGTELALCQRYYEISSALFLPSAWASVANTIWWKVTKRAVPTITSLLGTGANGVFSPSFDSRENTSGAFQTVANTAASGGSVTASAEL